MLLSIIIINYKTFDLTKKCIDSIKKLLGDDSGKKIELIIVDNGSGNEDVKFLQSLRDRLGFKFISSEENLGFAAGCNFGAQMATGENLLFLNSDTIVEKGIMEMAEDLSRQTEIGIMGGKIVGENQAIEKSAGKFYNPWHLFLMLIGGQRIGLDRFAPKEFKKVDFVSGGFMMVKKDVFDNLSGFDEDYFMYLEDMDLCRRAIKKNIETYYFPKAQVIHRQHGSSNRAFAIVNIYKSMIVFYRKNMGKIEYNIGMLLLYTKAAIVFLIAIILNRKSLRSTYWEVLKLF